MSTDNRYVITDKGTEATRRFRGWDLSSYELKILKFLKRVNKPTSLQEITDEFDQSWKKSTVVTTVQNLTIDGYISKSGKNDPNRL